MEIGKVDNFTSFKAQNVETERSSNPEINIPQITEETQKMASSVAMAQGQAAINISKTSKILQKCSDEQVVKAKSIVKKAKVPTQLADAKTNILSDINAELESRYLRGQLANKSAQEASIDILRLSPTDLEAKKAELKEQYGQKVQDKKVAKKEQQAITRANQANARKMSSLETFVAFMLPEEHYLVDEPPIKQRVPRIVCKEQGIDAFTQAYADKIISSYDALGLVKVLEAINTDGLYNNLDKEQKALLSQTIRSQLEFLYYQKQYSSELGEGSAENSAKFIQEETDRISDINAEKETRYLKSQLAHKSAEKSAMDIIKLNPVDLSARKMKLQERYADKVQEKHAKAAEQEIKKIGQLQSEELEKVRNERIQKMRNFATFLAYPAFIHVPEEVCIEQGMEAFVQAYADNMIESYHPTWLQKVLENIGLEDPIRNQLDEDQKDILRQAIKSELEFLYYKKQFQSDLPKGAAEKSAEFILENSPVDLGQRKIYLEERFADKLSKTDDNE